MHDIYISGTGHWKAQHLVTNEEIVSSFNEYVRLYNIEHEEEILSIDFILNIERIADAVQPETDKLLSGL